MPPPLEQEEEFEYSEHNDEAFASDFDGVIDIDSPVDTISPEAASFPQSLLETQQTPPREPQQELREASPVTLVVSDIPAQANHVQRTAMPAHKTTNFKEKIRQRGKKRAGDTRSAQGPMAKKRKGNKRELPCVYCVRRLANDPKWTCHDVLVDQNGVKNYKGLRCTACVKAHVSCHAIPDKATESVWTLVKAAVDVAASDGADKIQPLATYEAAIGPALRAIIGIPEPHASEPRKRKSNNTSGSQPRPSTSKHQSPQGLSPWTATPTQPFPPADPGASQQQYAQADPSNFFAPLPHQYHHDCSADLEKLERQALRRRKVEALEAISHTAALFLAEFMTLAKRQSSSTGEANEQLGGSGGQCFAGEDGPAQNQGMDYAAAAARVAASMLPQPARERVHNHQPYSYRTSAEAHLNAANDSDSDNDSSGASTNAVNNRVPVLAAQTPAAQNEENIELDPGYDFDEDRVAGKQENEEEDEDKEEEEDDDDDESSTKQGSEVKIEEE